MKHTFDPDQLATRLLELAALARRSPPAWEGAKISIPVISADGHYIGKALPGKGLYLPHDLKYYGITKDIPGVFCHSVVMRLQDVLRSERWAIRAAAVLGSAYLFKDWLEALPYALATITTYDGIIAGRAGGKSNDIAVTKSSFTTTANDWYSMARIAGMPGAMTFDSATPPTGAVPTRATAGAWSLGLSNPTSPDKKYLLTFGFTAVQQINIGILIDILTQSGSFRLTVATAETVATPPALTRYTTGAGVMIGFVTTTGASATATTMTVTYTDQDGNASQTTTIAGPATATIADEMWPDTASTSSVVPVALGTGDYGARELKQTQLSGGLAAGVVAGLLYFPLAYVPGITANAYVERDSTVQVDGLTELVAASDVLGCLNMIILPSTTSTGIFTAFLRTVAG